MHTKLKSRKDEVTGRVIVERVIVGQEEIDQREEDRKRINEDVIDASLDSRKRALMNDPMFFDLVVASLPPGSQNKVLELLKPDDPDIGI
jgi:hypothetical protein